MLDLLLVSQSPRRRELLRQAGFSFRVDTVKVSEIIEKNVNLGDAVARVAQTKVEAYLEQHNYLKSQNILLLGADTIVALGDQILGKPKNPAQACQFLQQLAGKTHSVITGLCLLNLATDELYAGFETSKVSFRELTVSEIKAYVDSGEPMDKAGAYAIQGDGQKLVKAYSGSWSNIVGLPLEHLERVLKHRAWSVSRG